MPACAAGSPASASAATSSRTPPIAPPPDRNSEQDAVAELLHDPPEVDRDHAARDDVEPRRELRRPLVAVGRRQGGVPGEVDERDRRRIDGVWLGATRAFDRPLHEAHDPLEHLVLGVPGVQPLQHVSLERRHHERWLHRLVRAQATTQPVRR